MANIHNFPNPPGAVWVEPELPTVPEILGCKPDNGDVQLAYRILNLHSTEARPIGFRPAPRVFSRHCNKVLRRIWRTERGGGERDIIPDSVAQKRVIEANKRILSAIHTIAGVRRPGHPRWSPDTWIRISPWQRDTSPNGILIYTNWDFPKTVNTLTWASEVEVPLSVNQFDIHYANADVTQLAQDRPRTGKTWPPTYYMVLDAQNRENEDIFDDLACYGFEAKPHFMHPQDKPARLKENLEYQFWAGPTPKNENSLWYALALLVEHNPTKAKKIKRLAAEWFQELMYDQEPNSQGNPHRFRRAKRFRMYSQLLADSARCADPDDEEIWGKMNMFRALCSNRPDAGMPKEAGYHEMLHMLADFFHTEIITFTRPDRSNLKLRDRNPINETIETQARHADFAYEMRVYGEQSPGTSPSFEFRQRGQILLVTDSCLRYFQPVTHVTSVTGEDEELHGSLYLDTSAFDKWDRHSPMPWWPGFRRNADNTGWTGDWDNQQLRPGLRLHPAMSVFDPPAIWQTLQAWGPWDPGNPPTRTQLESPYEYMKNLTGGIFSAWKTWFEGDEDCDLWNMVQPEGLRRSWRHPEAQGQVGPDRRIALSENRARTGAKTPKYTSKRQLELIEGVEEAFLVVLIDWRPNSSV
ncbi:hypothetical protein CKAH01_12632 [Colletotrichum kahawae]|uniref:Uncharacterized protein n=1 Tax=Colletotrichum kahawae TaxID=34407 RepID=A0AAD9YQG5_COLKA|nr:hypothetical protein CKAH01_12632 [Colletotrichum kahawae]